MAFAVYAPANGDWEAHALQVLGLGAGKIADIVAYLRPDLVQRAGLPERLDAPPPHGT